MAAMAIHDFGTAQAAGCCKSNIGPYAVTPRGGRLPSECASAICTPLPGALVGARRNRLYFPRLGGTVTLILTDVVFGERVAVEAVTRRGTGY